MSLRHALLGLLREGPKSGYDLLQMFKRSLHQTWPATQSQVYTELTKLADAGLLVVTAHGPRGRKEYTLTDAGLEELRRWMLETEPDRYPRSEALLRVFLLGALTRDEARDYLAWLGQKAAEDEVALTAFEDSIDWDHEDDLQLYGHMVVDFGKRLWVMSQEWADWAVAQIPAQAADDDPAAESGPPAKAAPPS
ncbi:MAG TPA: PadR family transcriptional regulator [Actinocrinis sp.]|uniref:PadR family transcriptional regulator n=1 Tax=Actinocrinis sp. TaxID=1920516 RepID=UPI002DDD3839|nr:PadR family transcriptional regulator [Actinocrinis sp.]HEV3173704.1 PadR family transcriptional regulator [Actinocrinis sp.]